MGIATGLSLASGLALALVTAWLLWPLVPSLPIWDEWFMAEVWNAHYGDGSIAHQLLRDYQGHYNLLPRLILYLVGLATGHAMAPEVALCWAAGIATWALVAWAIARAEPRLLFIAGPAAGLVLSVTQFENYVSGWPFSQVLGQLFATAAVGVAALDLPTARRTLAAAALATAGMFSFASCIAAWPACLVAALLRRPLARTPIAIYSVGLLAGLGLARLGASRVGAGLAWEQLPGHFALLIARPLFPDLSPDVGTVMVAGVVCGLATAAALVALYATDALGGEARRMLVALACLGAGSAALIAIGRSQTERAHLLGSHYITATYPVALALFVAVAGLLLRARDANHGSEDHAPLASGRRTRRMMATTALAAWALLPPLHAIEALRSFVPTLHGWAQIGRAHERALIEGTISDEQIRASHHPDPDYVRWGNAVYRRHHLGPYRSLHESQDR